MVPPPVRALPPRDERPDPPERATRAAGSVDALLHALRSELPAELASQLRTGATPDEAPEIARVATGIADVDALLGGGLPRGRLVEITGAPSSGRTSLAHALACAATRAGELAAWVDAADAFDPASAAAAGVDLGRVLWARPTRAREALRCAERLLEARGFGVVLLDLDRPGEAPRRDGDASAPWLRMTRSARASGTSLVLLSSRARLGAFAALSLEAQGLRACFAPEPEWLEGLETQWVTARSRIGRSAPRARVAWRFSAP